VELATIIIWVVIVIILLIVLVGLGERLLFSDWKAAVEKKEIHEKKITRYFVIVLSILLIVIIVLR
jgi:succinate dehydrogenase/fumarate reductase cytochrome b subunit